MGLGDDILSTVQARELFRTTGRKVVFGDGQRVYLSEIFEENPHICQPGESGLVITNYPHRRPHTLGEMDDRMTFNPLFRAQPGDVYLTEDEKAIAPDGDYAVVEPNVKSSHTADNKDWGFQNWQKVVDRWPLPIELVQVGQGESLENIRRIEVESFRQACGALHKAKMFLGTDGALHHAAAAFAIPGVVIWACTPPELLGYDLHENLGGSWCGALKPCEHCRELMDSISVEDVLGAAERVAGRVEGA